ncbi:TetR/AcrR family transcriptional regulator, partial [Pseudomonas sp. MWU13-2625]
MRYSASHKQETRERLLQSSAAQAKNEGFSTVGVDALLKAIRLNGGAFHPQFTSPAGLFQPIVHTDVDP